MSIYFELFFESKVFPRAVKFIVELALLLLQGFIIHMTSQFSHLFPKHPVILIQDGSRNVLDLHMVVSHRLGKYKHLVKRSRHGMEV